MLFIGGHSHLDRHAGLASLATPPILQVKQAISTTIQETSAKNNCIPI